MDPIAYMQVKMEDVIRRESRDQSALMAEKYLSKFDTSCVQRSFCEVGTTLAKDATQEERAAELAVE